MGKSVVITERPRPDHRYIRRDLIDEPALAARVAFDTDMLNDLADSIKLMGIIQPLIVFPVKKRYEIAAGHRRWTAAGIAGEELLPCLVYSNKDFAVEAVKLHENLNREDLSDAEMAIFFADLVTLHGYDEERLCKAVQKKADFIADRLRLLEGDPDVFEALKQRQIRYGVARELNKITDPKYRKMYLQNAIDCDPPHRVVVGWVAQWRQHGQPIADYVPPADAPEGERPIVVHVDKCEVCGGHLDPWNLVNVRIHGHEWDLIKKSLAQAARGEAS